MESLLPFLQGTCTPYNMPVYPGAQCKIANSLIEDLISPLSRLVFTIQSTWDVKPATRTMPKSQLFGNYPEHWSARVDDFRAFWGLEIPLVPFFAGFLKPRGR